MQAKSTTKLEQTFASLNTALAPIAKQMQPLPVRTLGTNRFINMRDLMFVIQHQDKPFMKQHKQYIDKLKLKFYASALIIPLSLAINIKLQRIFPNTFGGKRFHNFVLDMLWYTGTTYTMILVNQLLPKQKKFQQIKDMLIQKENPQYLVHMHENFSKYRLAYVLQVGRQRNYSDLQIGRLAYLAKNLANNNNANNNNISTSTSTNKSSI